MLGQGACRNGCGRFRHLAVLGLSLLLIAPAWGAPQKNNHAPTVDFTGNTFFGKSRLRTWATSSSPTAALLTSPYDPDRARTAAALIAQAYKNFGFLDVRVAYRLTVGKQANKDRLVFEIEEGPRYKVAEVRIVGVGVDEQQKLLKDLQLQPGEDCSLEIVRQDREHLQRVLTGTDTQFSVREQTLTSASGKVTVVYEVTHGGVIILAVPAAEVGRMTCSGPHLRQWLFHHQGQGNAGQKAGPQPREEVAKIDDPIGDPPTWTTGIARPNGTNGNSTTPCTGSSTRCWRARFKNRSKTRSMKGQTTGTSSPRAAPRCTACSLTLSPRTLTTSHYWAQAANMCRGSSFHTAVRASCMEGSSSFSEGQS
jgi:hypothetical protein